jgi:hypothetical protein
MKTRPILFSGEMVCAILAGTKTQTRRTVKPLPVSDSLIAGAAPQIDSDGDCVWFRNNLPIIGSKNKYGIPGDRLWVRETWKPHCEGPISDKFPLGTCVKYRADGRCIKPIEWTDDQGAWCEANEEMTHWRPSIFMPRWASRITLEIVSVRVERLQDISEADAEAEGIDFIRHYPDCDETLSAKTLYEVLWESINGKGSWAANPWVWVVEFKRI